MFAPDFQLSSFFEGSSLVSLSIAGSSAEPLKAIGSEDIKIDQPLSGTDAAALRISRKCQLFAQSSSCPIKARESEQGQRRTGLSRTAELADVAGFVVLWQIVLKNSVEGNFRRFSLPNARLGRWQKQDLVAACNTPAGETLPILHQRTPLVEQVTASIRGFCLVLHDMRQRHLYYLARMAGALGGPIGEGRAEAVCGHSARSALAASPAPKRWFGLSEQVGGVS